jgi:hypothetical protein
MAEPASTLAAGSVGVVETKYLDLPAPVRLDCGRALHPVRVAYETYGTLSPRRDNVILVCHALSGDAHAAGSAKTPPAMSTRDGFGAADRDGTAGKGLLRRRHEPARRLPRHHGPVVDRPGDRQAVRGGLPRDHRRRHGPDRARVP